MQSRIRNCLSDAFIRPTVETDFAKTFGHLGLGQDEAAALTATVLVRLQADDALPAIERDIFAMFARIRPADGASTLTGIIDQKLQGRAETIFNQVAPHLAAVTGKGLDFGAGDGKVTQRVHDRLGKDITGIDVRPYRAPEITVPIQLYNGQKIDYPTAGFAFGLATNVFHHEVQNENCLSELSRVVRDRLVIIETVPVGGSNDDIERDRERTFMNDYLYNRLFHDADIPVPGTYETPAGWSRRIEKYGWKTTVSENLGVDLPVIADTHHLLVFDR